MSSNKLSVISARTNTLRGGRIAAVEPSGKAILHVNATAVGAQKRSIQIKVVVTAVMCLLTSVPPPELADPDGLGRLVYALEPGGLS